MHASVLTRTNTHTHKYTHTHTHRVKSISTMEVLPQVTATTLLYLKQEKKTATFEVQAKDLTL